MDFIIVILVTLAVGIVTALYFLNKQKPSEKFTKKNLKNGI